jgi:hypothetical protein
LKLEEFEKEFNSYSVIYPNDYLVLNQHLALFLNQKLTHLADIEPAANHENATCNYLLS